MTRPVAEATILGDFSRTATLSAHGRSHEFGTRQGMPFITMRAPGRAPGETYRVDYTLGSKRFQWYLSTLPDGRMCLMPVFWHVEAKRWLDWRATHWAVARRLPSTPAMITARQSVAIGGWSPRRCRRQDAS